MIIYDAEEQILGRLSSVIAKKLLNGEEIIVVNCEKAVVSGIPKSKTEEYSRKVKRGDTIHGPFFPKQPDEIFRRTVRGMIPWDRTRGREAFKRLKVYIGVPEELKGKEFKKTEEADANKLRTKYITLEKISLAVGGQKRW